MILLSLYTFLPETNIVKSVFYNNTTNELEARDAAIDLQVTPGIERTNNLRIGAIKHKETHLKSHLIAGDVLFDFSSFSSVPESYWEIYYNTFEPILKIIDRYLDLACWKLNKSQEFKEVCNCKQTGKRVFKFLNFIVDDIMEENDFVFNSDWFVPLSSQTANITNPNNNVTIFGGLTAFHSSIRDRLDVGNHVFDLLHEPLSSSKFDYIPESPASQQNKIKQEKQEQEQQENDLPAFTTMPTLTVFTPNDSISVNPDSLMNISFSVSSTDGLFLKKINFQDISLVDTSLYDFANYDINVSGDYLDKQNLTVMAFYVFSDTSFVLSENLVVYVNPVENPIELIAEAEMNYLKINESKYINTKAIFKNFITDVSQTDSLKIAIENTNIIEFINNKFIGKSEGMTSVEFSYMGKIDSVWFEVKDTLAIPDTIPSLLYPVNLSMNIELTDTLKWSNPSNTNFIDIQVATDSSFTELVYTNTVFNDSISVLSNLNKLSTYYWRVKAVGLGGESDWSEVWSFTTIPDSTRINLNSGWNLISTHIQPQVPDSMNNVLDDVAGNMLIAKDIAGAVYIPQYDINTIGKWDVTQGYQLYMSQADTLTVTGVEVIPSETPIQLSAGWNMISYLRKSEISAELAFASITDNNNLLIAKTLDGKVFIPIYNINTIGNLKPGVGYRVYLTTSDTLVYPDN